LWIDILQNKIHEYNPFNQQYKYLDTKSNIGSFAIIDDRYLIAALQEGIFRIDRENGERMYRMDPEAHLPLNRFNDGKCDPAGRFWAGSMPMNELEPTGSLYMFEGTKSERKIEQVTVSNGLTWSLDRRCFYFIDSPTLSIVSYDYEIGTGAISNKNIVVKMDVKEGYPDGMTIDEEGMLWVAHWDGWQVARWDPETGKKILSVRMPVSKPTSVCFGGANMDELFVTSDSRGIIGKDWNEQPLAGGTFVVRGLGVKGLHLFRFQDHLSPAG
jgi:sugar lactone lactonase YvrE